MPPWRSQPTTYLADRSDLAHIPTFPHNTFALWAFGGEILSADGKRCLLDSPECIRAYQFLADLRWSRMFRPHTLSGGFCRRSGLRAES